MKVKKKPSVFEASDGTEFETQAEAERYQALTDAERQYRNASAAYGQMLAETQKTRDGVAFQFELFQDYWYPIHWGGKPCVIRIGFRMLSNPELSAAQGFPASYLFTGTKADVTRQIGNSVSPNVAEAITKAILSA